MYPPKKILFPVDFSERCTGASRFVEALAGRFDAELILLNVVQPAPYAGLLPGTLEYHTEWLAAFQRDEFRHFRVRRIVEQGDPSGKILEASHSHNVDLIMMPTHGFGPYRRFLLGSVTAKVLHAAECPVWTGVHLDQAPPLESIHIRKVLCAVDLGPHSEPVLDWAGKLAFEYQSSLAVVYATPAYATFPERYFDADVHQVAIDSKEAVRKLLLERKFEAEVYVDGGEVATVVRRAAVLFQSELLVIGRSPEAGLLGRLRANAYAIIRQSPCPVLSV
jgi:nucleotide-binding universal stress UspA family protein